MASVALIQEKCYNNNMKPAANVDSMVGGRIGKGSFVECDKCINEQRLTSLEEDRKRNSDQHKEFYDKLGDVAINDGRKEEREKSINRSLDLLAAGVAELKLMVTEMQNRPTQQVNRVKDRIIDKIVDFILLAVIGYIIFVIK